jgi:hypothetical protein
VRVQRGAGADADGAFGAAEEGVRADSDRG